jgi:hypothetical protein
MLLMRRAVFVLRGRQREPGRKSMVFVYNPGFRQMANVTGKTGIQDRR